MAPKALDNLRVLEYAQKVSGPYFGELCASNPSTGFACPESAQISDRTIVQQTDHKYVALEKVSGHSA